jgi:hypothetical protein
MYQPHTEAAAVWGDLISCKGNSGSRCFLLLSLIKLKGENNG